MKYGLMGLSLLLVSYQGMGATIKQVDVFVTSSQRTQVVGCDEDCQIWDIDATENTLNQFFGELPNNEDEAYRVVMDKINSPEWKVYERQVIQSQQTIIKAFELGVKKYPAIVIHGDKVVYGITDVTQAKEDVRREDK